MAKRWLRGGLWMACGCLVVVGAGAVGLAQDTRVVTEPKIPAVCTKLEARVASLNGTATIFSDEVERTLDTERIQKGLDGCGAGKAVELSYGPTCRVSQGCGLLKDGFITGPLEMREGVTLLIDKGVTLYGSTDPAVYEIASAGEPVKCGTSSPRPTSFPTFSTDAKARPRGGCKPLITINVKNAAIMGEGTIDGRGYAKLLGHDYSWWEMARKAQPNDDLYYSTRLIVASHADGLILYGVHLNNSPNFHVSVNGTNGFTAWGVHLQTPVNKALLGTANDARNTDGIDPGTSSNVTVAHSWIDNGDDNIAVKQGITHMSVIDNHFYSGHGMSIGSETVLGQSYLLVDGLVENHTTSGVRIKSNVKRGGPVHDLVYKNICMKDVPIPIAISPYYTNQTVEPFEDPKYEGDKIPDYKGITLENIYSETPGDVLIAGLNDAHRTEVTLHEVLIQGIKPSQVHLAYDDLTNVSGNTNFPLEGKSVKIMAVGPPEKLLPHPCADKFVPYR